MPPHPCSFSQLVTWTCWETELRLCVHVRAHMWLRVYSNIYGACVYVCARACVCVCARVRAFVCVYICVYRYVCTREHDPIWHLAYWLLTHPIWCISGIILFATHRAYWSTLYDAQHWWLTCSCSYLMYIYLTHTGHTGWPYSTTGGWHDPIWCTPGILVAIWPYLTRTWHTSKKNYDSLIICHRYFF